MVLSRFCDTWLDETYAVFPFILGLFALAGSGRLVSENGQGRCQKSANSSGNGDPKSHSNIAISPQNKGFWTVSTSIFDRLGSPAGRVSEQSQSKENSSEGLKWTTNGKDRAANAATAACGQKRKKVSDDHQGQTQAKKQDSSTPGVRIFGIV